MATHELKIWPPFFEAIASGDKTFEWRKDDRDPPFRLGDWLHLKECSPEPSPMTGRHFETGRWLAARVSWILRSPDFDVPSGYVIMSLNDITTYPKE